MPKYFFDAVDGKEQRDLIGAELPNDGAAIQEAQLRAMNGTAHQINHYKGSKTIAVRTSAGSEIYRCAIRRVPH